MRAKLNHSGLVNVVATGQTDVTKLVSFAGGDELLKKSDRLYSDGNSDDARSAVREALRIALQRLDAVHGTHVQDEPQGDSALLSAGKH
ncbi:MAG: hypothetical protein ACMV0F_03730 [Trichlorobacter sp.]|jgi:hypothetical protein